MLYCFKSTKQLSYNRPHLYNRKGRTNLREEGETEAVIRIKAALVNLIILFHVIACCLESTSAENQERQRKSSVKYAIKKATIRKTVPCLGKSDLIILKRKIIVKPRKRKKQGT
jgi:hypothetical protein